MGKIENDFITDMEKYRLGNPPPTDGVKIVDLYQKIENNLLDLTPSFQRKLVWKKIHKLNFIKTILLNFPFPEVYIASRDVDVDLKQSSEVVVDGKQRLTTICNYINGDDIFSEKSNHIPLYHELNTEEKKLFLNYKVSVRDLKDISQDHVQEMFRRINSTEYSLNKIELVHSDYGDSDFLCFAKQLADSKDIINFDYITYNVDESFCRELQKCIYEEWGIFQRKDQERMFVMMFFMNVIITILNQSYHSRNGKFEDFVVEYNDGFPMQEDIYLNLKHSFEGILKIKLSKGSFFLSKSMLFTLLVEFVGVSWEEYDLAKICEAFNLIENKHENYLAGRVEGLSVDDVSFFEAARNSVNEKKNRETRSKVIRQVLLNSRNT